MQAAEARDSRGRLETVFGGHSDVLGADGAADLGPVPHLTVLTLKFLSQSDIVVSVSS